jgi:pimeloyl-ACP methyl ester carboxylesterase
MNYSIRFYTDFVARLIESGPNPVSIVGSSLGGQIAAETAIKIPELVSKLILICPAGVPPFSFKGGEALRRYAKIAEAKGEQDVKRILALIDDSHVNDEYAKSVYQRISMPGAREAFIGALRGSARAPRLGKRIGKIRSPVMVLWGQNDKMIPPKYAAPFIGMENFRLIMIENCGHRPHADRPELFNNLVLSFLEN